MFILLKIKTKNTPDFFQRALERIIFQKINAKLVKLNKFYLQINLFMYIFINQFIYVFF